MKKTFLASVAMSAVWGALQSSAFAQQSVTVAIEGDVGAPNGTQLGAGATNMTKDGLDAENDYLWGVSNGAVRQGMLHFVYSDLAKTTLPATIQAGTYVFEARIGNGNAFDFPGLNTPANGNTSAGAVAGFFSTFANGDFGTTTAAARTNAELSKNHMATEFNNLTGVTYIAPSEAAPADLEWTTWTFTWVIAPGSPAIGTNPYFAVYTNTGAGGSAFWDDSTLTYSATVSPPENSISVNFHSNDANALADHQLSAGELAGLSPLDGDHWNNINLGAPAAHSSSTIFPATQLKDALGNTNAATISTTAQSTYFVGYASGSASTAAELGLSGNQDDLFNSYLGLNGPDGDGTPADSAILTLIGLGPDFTTEGYSLIIYSDSDITSSGSGNRTSTFTLTPGAGSAIQVLTEDNSAASGGCTFDGTFIPSDNAANGADYSNYVVIQGLTAPGFTLEVTSPDGGRGAISGFQILAGDVQVTTLPVINSFTADDSYVQSGDAVNLSWNVANADSLVLDPGGINVTGLGTYLIDPISETTTYTLTATNESGSVHSEVKVSVGPKRPNILLMLVDDFGPMDTSVPFAYDHYDDTGIELDTAFNNFYQTPNMEMLASHGMKFSQAYAMPMCSPTRVSLMTGNNSTRHGVTVHLNVYETIDNASFSIKNYRGPNNWRYLGMDGTDVALPQLMKNIGYHTFMVGKDHMSHIQQPTAIGFDVVDSGLYKATALTPKATTMLEDAVASGAPFFGYISYRDVHTAFYTASDATGDYSAAYNANHGKFATMVESVDHSLGAIMTKLDELGVAEDTLVIFLGDNGSDSPALSDEGWANGTAFDDFPMRGKKGSGYEGGIRVPLLVSWGSRNANNLHQQALSIPAASVEHDIVTVEDIAPTILSAANAAVPMMDGYDLTPYFRAEAGTHRPQKVLRHMPHEHRSNYFTCFREGDWKIFYRYNTNLLELYNLATDPDESDNLAAAQPEKVLAMARAMARELDGSWGVYGKLWPTHNPTQVATPARPLVDDPFYIDFGLNGRALVDSDLDGLVDMLEDADANGLVGMNETDSENSDTDGDHTNDYAETRLGLNPLDPNSLFAAQSSIPVGGGIRLTWPSSPGLSFNILASDDLSAPVGEWDVLVPDISADGVLSETVQDIPIDAARKFFSVELLPASN